MEEYGNWKSKVLLIGAAAGLMTGLLAAYMLIKRGEMKEEPPKLTPGEGVQLGLGVLGLLRLISK
jgi:hypothetical protein